jgi:hypothetical protein
MELAPERRHSTLPKDGSQEIAVKQPSILDVVHGVKTIAPAHPEVSRWWYTPPQRLRLAGALPSSAGSPLSIEVVVQPAAGAHADSVPCERIARELSRALHDVTVAVRTHRGDAEERPLFRIVSQGDAASPTEAPRSA